MALRGRIQGLSKGSVLRAHVEFVVSVLAAVVVFSILLAFLIGAVPFVIGFVVAKNYRGLADRFTVVQL